MKLIKQLITIIIIYIILFIAFNQTNEDIINNSVLWLFIWPMAWTITIYIIILMVNMKRAYKRNKTVYMYDMDSLQNKIQRLELELDNEKEYQRIKGELHKPYETNEYKDDNGIQDSYNSVEDTTDYKPTVVESDIPFTDTITAYDCPQCGELMTRHTKKTWFCDNVSCNRKQWNIDKLNK